jgi:roadblock/LC7 domain-containing protein
LKKLCCVLLGIGLALASARSALAADPGPEVNPYECLGRYEAATGNRSMRQVRAELDKRLNPLFEGPEPPTVRAMKACVVAMLKSRLGDTDADAYYAMAVENDPEEPGYEFWYGRYYTGFRGARGVVVESAENHFYAALKKLDAKRAAGKFRGYHAVVEEWTQKQLMYAYQEDGVHFLPWAKAYPQRGYAGRDVPSAALSAQFQVSRDTRDFFRNNEMRLFTGEMMFAASSYRQFNQDKGQMYELARAPLRYRGDVRVRLRHNAIGALDFSAAYEKTQEGQVNSYYLVPGSTDKTSAAYANDLDLKSRGKPLFTSPNLRELGVGYERVFPLLPLMDFKLKGGVKYIDRQGVIEFQEFDHEKFLAYEARPSFSRFLGPDKLTLDLVWIYMDVSEVPFGVKSEAARDKYIRAANLEYAIYRPFVLPALGPGGLGMVRAPTRGWYWNLGAADDSDVYGTRTVKRRDAYLGTRFEGAGSWDAQLQGTYSTSDIDALDLSSGAVGAVIGSPMKSTSFRTSGYLQYRIINPDAIPGVSGSVIAPDMIHVVTPFSWDKGLSGSCENFYVDPTTGLRSNLGLEWDTTYTSQAECYKTYENVRVGAELWTKFFGTAFGGPAFLTTVGYDYQYFYQLKKAVHNVHMSVRVGWDAHKL